MRYKITKHAGTDNYAAFVVAPGKYYDGRFDDEFSPNPNPKTVKRAVERAGHTVISVERVGLMRRIILAVHGLR